ncbi:MAG TPA: EamA family transporter RarD, partial [Terriglobia bacterium]|nr:EamA family transporter RarD [Terriglobia bacterium]
FPSTMRKGMAYAVAAYSLWGLVPIYWKWLQTISAVELIGHRIFWSCLALFALLALRGEWRAFQKSVRNRRAVIVYTLAALLVGANWLIYVWAVNAGFIVETSLGYFINPLVNILLGVFILGERLRRAQWMAIGLAAIGVIYLTISYGSPPWIALALASTFGLYGLVKKTAILQPLQGLALETGLLFLPAVVYLGYLESAGRGALGHVGPVTNLLLIGAGPVTTVPLIFFAAAAKRIPLSWMGLFQYIAPTIQFLLGVLVFKEAFSRTQFLGFSLVWLALIICAVEGVVVRQQLRQSRQLIAARE